VNQGNLELFTEFDQRLKPKGRSIISDDSAGATKSRYNIFQEADNHFVRSASGGDNFYPFSEVVSCSQNPSVLAT
jgi:hypothetical protein